MTLGHPVAAVAPVDYINKVGDKAFNRKPVGTGPYMVQKWVHNQYVDLVRNPDYWDKANAGVRRQDPHAGLSRRQHRVARLPEGRPRLHGVPPGQVYAAKNNARSSRASGPPRSGRASATYYININMTDKTLGYPAGAKGMASAPGADLQHADTPAVINVVDEGVDAPATGLVPPGIPGYSSGRRAVSRTTLPRPSSTWSKHTATVPTLNYWFNTDSGQQKVAEALQAGWKQVGINVKLSTTTSGTPAQAR